MHTKGSLYLESERDKRQFYGTVRNEGMENPTLTGHTSNLLNGFV